MADFKGKHVWFELNTTDLKAAEAFYSGVTGWVPRDAGKRIRSPKVTSVTSGSRARASTRSRSAIAVTQTGQPGPLMRRTPSGSS